MKTTPTIGEMIKVTFGESGMSMSEFAGKIHASCPDVYSLFKKDDISLKQLRLISEVLNHDFMKDLCDCLQQADVLQGRSSRFTTRGSSPSGPPPLL